VLSYGQIGCDSFVSFSGRIVGTENQTKQSCGRNISQSPSLATVRLKHNQCICIG
jgi:hypothetical protein